MLDAIYYPYFYPPEVWLRRAALCWNTVYRLRTPDALPDSAEIAELDAALGGVLGDLDFHSVYRDVIQEFLDWLDANLERWQRMPRTPDERSPLVGLLPSKFPGGELIDELVNRQVASVETHESERLIPKWELEEWESRFLEAPARAYGPPRRGSAQYRYEELQ